MIQEAAAVFLNLHEIHNRQSLSRCHQWVFQAGLELLHSCRCQAKTFHQLPFSTWNFMAFSLPFFWCHAHALVEQSVVVVDGVFFVVGGMPMMPPPWVGGSW